jgi:2-phospho-L-lactate guanylyltransferase
MIYSIIPVKPFREAKTRLKPVLNLAQRANLSRILLEQTIKVALTVSQVVVVSRSAAARRVAKQGGAWAIVEHKTELNAAVSQGVEWAKIKGATAVLILPLDLPLLKPTELQDLIELGMQKNPSIVIAPCHQNRGTNALFMHPPNLMTPQFGPDSFTAHRTAAESICIPPKIYRVPGLALDLDTPEDWRRLVSTERLDALRAFQ